MSSQKIKLEYFQNSQSKFNAKKNRLKNNKKLIKAVVIKNNKYLNRASEEEIEEREVPDQGTAVNNSIQIIMMKALLKKINLSKKEQESDKQEKEQVLNRQTT